MEEHELDFIEIKNDYDAIRIRQAVRRRALELGFSMIIQTKISTVASELSRNILNYVGTGEVRVRRVTDVSRSGLKIVFQYNGPGTKNIAQVLQEGYSNIMSLGMGLTINRKFSNAFDIESKGGKETKVTITNWVKSNEVKRPPQFSNKRVISGGAGH